MLANGVVSDYDYDEMNRLVQLSVFEDDDTDWVHDGGEDLLAEYVYELALDGKRKSVAETDSAGVATSIDWLYDKLGRLLEEDYDYDTTATTAADFLAEYVYDLVGNRVQKTLDKKDAAGVDETIDYEYDANDRLLTEAKNVAVGTADDRYTLYEYGPNAAPGSGDGGDHTVQTKKTVKLYTNGSGGTLSETEYFYNYQGRLETVEDNFDADAHIDATYEYTYNDQGIRVRVTEEIDGNDDGDLDDQGIDSTITTDHLIDANNPTGYAQVLEEKVSSSVVKTYTLGHDVIAQQAPAVESGNTLYLLYDGHSSTRGLVDPAGAPLSGQIYRYDAFGNRLDESTALTSILFSGEQTDATGLQYLRARYYDPATGRFNRLDPFAGDSQDPQSLHKYLYCSANPIMGIDPSGEFLAMLLTAGSRFAMFTVEIGVQNGPGAGGNRR